MRAGPSVRTIFEFTCVVCGAVESVRWPHNPMQEEPSLVQSVPQGWSLAYRGSEPQSPSAMCPKPHWIQP